MACNCIDDVNAKLAEQENAKLDLMFFFGGGAVVERTYIPLIRLDNGRREHRRNRRTAIVATFCPFCGQRHDPVPQAGASAPACDPSPDAPPAATGGVDDQAPPVGVRPGAAPLAPETGA